MRISKVAIDNPQLAVQIAILNDPNSQYPQKADALDALQALVYSDGKNFSKSDISLLLSCVTNKAVFALQDAEKLKGLTIMVLATGFCQNIAQADLDYAAFIFFTVGKDTTYSGTVRAAAVTYIGTMHGNDSVKNPSLLENSLVLAENILSSSIESPAIKVKALYLLVSMSSRKKFPDTADYFERCLRSIENALSTTDPNALEIYSPVLNALQGIFNSYPTHTHNDIVRALDIAQICSLVNDADAKSLIGFALGSVFYGNGSTPSQSDLNRGISIIMSNLDFPDTQLKQNTLRYLEQLFTYIERDKFSTSKLQDAMLLLWSYICRETADSLKISAMQTLQSALYATRNAFDQSFLAAMHDNMHSIADNSSNSDELRTAAGGLFVNFCFLSPDLFERLENKFLNIDKELAAKMQTNSPDWFLNFAWYLGNPKKDYETIYRISRKHPNEPFVRTLFSTYMLTYLGQLGDECLEHLYYNLNRRTGKQLFFVDLTAHRGLYPTFANFIKPEDVGKFDFRVFQLPKDHMFLEYLKKTSETLGIKPRDVDPDGPKWDFFNVSGHGLDYGVFLKFQKFASGISEDVLDREDAALFYELGKYFSKNADGWFASCLTADPTVFLNGAEAAAKYMGMKMYGSQVLTGNSTPIYSQLASGEYTLTDVYYQTPSNSYDYKNPGILSMPDWTVSETSSRNLLSWRAKSGSDTEGYDVDRSEDGKIFIKIAFIPKNGADSYSFEDTSAPSGKTIYYRVNQRNSVLANTDGSRDYTFKFSSVKRANGATSVNLAGQPQRLELLQNYPNPFRASTNIQFRTLQNGPARIIVFDALGQEVGTLADENMRAGAHQMKFDASGLPPGVYFYRLETENGAITKKMQILK